MKHVTLIALFVHCEVCNTLVLFLCCYNSRLVIYIITVHEASVELACDVL
jgi:hypothetical protein